MSEFDLIREHFTRHTQHTNLSVGDDAALISVSKGMELAVSADMLVAGTHFFPDADAYQLGWKSLAVNLSDMAAMGADPKWATLSIALPQNDSTWLRQFSDGFFACADTFNIDLIGGDTTRGPLVISVQIMGEIPNGMAIKRSNAQVGDEIWVSGNIGNAALALAHIKGHLILPYYALAVGEKALHTPQPRVALGIALREIANSAIDISDGLLADLGHILARSKVGAILQLQKLPLTNYADKVLFNNLPSQKSLLQLQLTGGDDYELCFTANIEKHAEILQLGYDMALPLSCIGLIAPGNDLLLHGDNNEILNFKESGFDHFSQTN